MKKEAAINTKGLDRNIARTQRLVEKSVNIVHEFARELRPAVLDDLGLIPALHSFVKLFSKRTRIHVHLKVFAGVEQLDINRRTTLYRVAQEALTNVLKHAGRAQARVLVDYRPGAVRLEIADDGRGVNGRATEGGHGLVGMRERAMLIGGEVSLQGAPGKGTTVRLHVPLSRVNLRQEKTPPA